jgi:hypothetical protein
MELERRGSDTEVSRRTGSGESALEFGARAFTLDSLNPSASNQAWLSLSQQNPLPLTLGLPFAVGDVPGNCDVRDIKFPLEIGRRYQLIECFQGDPQPSPEVRNHYQSWERC